MSPLLRETLRAGLVRNLCSTQINVERFTLTEDGRGGATETWRVIGTHKGRIVNNSDREGIVGGGAQPTATWTLTLPVASDVMPHDRIRIVGDDSRYYEVVGSDFGQTDLLVQHIGLVEYVA